jgi:U1 small nuclear ribonucleoprotein 70kDa
MTDKLPPNLLALFAPRPPLRYLPPADHAPESRGTAQISGLAAFLPALKDKYEPEDWVPTESWLQKKDRIKLEKKERQDALFTDVAKECEQPSNLPTCDYSTSDLKMLANGPSLDRQPSG